jgi:hypothetical protein
LLDSLGAKFFEFVFKISFLHQRFYFAFLKDPFFDRTRNSSTYLLHESLWQENTNTNTHKKRLDHWTNSSFSQLQSLQADFLHTQKMPTSVVVPTSITLSNPELRGGHKPMSVTDAIEDIGFGMFQVKMLIACALCWLVGSVTFESVTWLIESMESNAKMHVGTEQRGLLAMATPLGILAGSPFMGTWSDMFGRSKLIVLAMAMTVIAFVVQLTSDA